MARVAYRGPVIPTGAWTVASIILLGVIPLLGIVAWLVGLVLHGLGRPTAGAMGATLFALGVAMGSTLSAAIGLTQRAVTQAAVFDAMIAVGLPLLFVVGLAMSGRRRAAGLLLAGASLPWAVYSGMYLLDIALGADWAPLFTMTMFVAGLGPFLIGCALAAAGDAVHAPDANAPAGRPGSRRPGSLGRRVLGDPQYGFPGPSVVFGMAAGLTTGLAFPTAPIVQVVATAVAAVVGTEIELRWIPPATRPAAEAYHWIGRAEIARFRVATGGPIPTSMRGFRAWLARTPETDATRPYRVEALTMLDAFDAARVELERMPGSTPTERLRRAALDEELRWRQGAPPDLSTLERLAADVGPPDDPERLHVDAMVAWRASQAALAALDPAWRSPLDRIRERLGPRAGGLHATALRRRTLVLALSLSGGIVLLNLLPR